nr:hypothetical protein [Tanacetum cinerariifolium]
MVTKRVGINSFSSLGTTIIPPFLGTLSIGLTHQLSEIGGSSFNNFSNCKKVQIAFEEEVARKLEAEMKAKMDKEERIAKEKDEANIAVIEEWDDVQATIEADRKLA